MPQPRVLILRAPGTNCDQEAGFAFEQAGARTEFVHINRLLESPAVARDFQILCLPGGFSYGDDLAAGRILANQIRHHLAETLAEFKAAGKLIIGICNGFQILIKSGVLFADEVPQETGGESSPMPFAGPPATLTLNRSGKFEDRWVELRKTAEKCVFLRGIERMYLPIAHAEGNFVPRTDAILRRLDANSQLVLRYARPDHSSVESDEGMLAYPDNPNGSTANVAGVCDETGRVFGLMPHPERFIDRTQHPRWTRGPLPERGDGLAVFENAVRYLA